MSQSTPAKEARYERHLMRQRGAGPRGDISANFGFSFDFPAPAAIAPAVDPSEPPTKRRKIHAPKNDVLVPTVTVVPDKHPKKDVDLVAEVGGDEAAQKNVLQTAPLELLHEKPRVGPGDDSFVVMVKARTFRARQCNRSARPTEGLSRPRVEPDAKESEAERSAEEQAAAVTSQASPASPQLSRRGQGRKRGALQTTDYSAAQPKPAKRRQKAEDSVSAPAAEASAPSLRRAMQRSAAMNIEPEEAEALGGNNVRRALAEADANITRRSVSPEKQAKAEVTERRTVGRRKPHRKAEPKSQMAATSTKKLRMIRVEAESEPEEQQLLSGAQVQAEPPSANELAELVAAGDVLRIARVSPAVEPAAKFKGALQRAATKPKRSRQAKALAGPESHGPDNAHRIPAAKEKASVAGTVESQEAMAISLGVAPIKQTPGLEAQPDPAKQTEAHSSAKHAVKAKSATGKRLVRLHSATTTGEDSLDWLLAPCKNDTSRAKPTVPPTQKRRSFGELADVDLDDLVTNIAFIAPVSAGREEGGLQSRPVSMKSRRR
ncbi:hypothetical protein BAUCODRAFT_158010 [Baudoinia panamericana UAMH 10762]|uniref:Uncharacterized protein n=1 Tax=Baudoinia panamericana (strain UAMH 10762) TaxID=717646 RepID=M2LJI5_BAUPA|nr:uncharacterized protein BAUCODRAFT_158010 [Baudoinia panamericana UAMH 10762]EMC94397.1 hypothetical protein BAUCODRAFT_158010 [Baudoinia panamericana UAMH 10762]